ncbi:MAG: hypothetical protein RSA45_04105 [Hydrogenoanaerobacterium sp.]
MNRDYDIDSILAEIKEKKAAEARRRPPQTDDAYDENPQRRSVRQAEYGDYDEPRQTTARREPVYREEQYDERPVRPQRRPAAPQADYNDYDEPRQTTPRREAAYEEAYDERDLRAEVRREPAYAAAESGRKLRPQHLEPLQPLKPPSHNYGGDDDYAERMTQMTDRSTRRATAVKSNDEYEGGEQNADYGEAESRREQREAYEEAQPRSSSSARAIGDRYNPADAIFALASEEKPLQNVRPQRTVQLPKEVYAAAAAEPKKASDDEFIMKYSGLSPIGSGVRKGAVSAGRESIRTNFGAAAEPSARGRAQQQKQAVPQPPELPKPELKGGFRLNPNAHDSTAAQPDSEAFTRMDIPISDFVQSGDSLEDTKDLPQGLALDGFAEQEAPEKPAEDIFETDEAPSKMEMDEYTSQSDAQGVKKDLDTMRGSLLFRLAASALCALGLLYTGLAQVFALPMPNIVSPTAAPGTYMLLNIVLLTIAALVSYRTVASGLVGMFTLKANNDSLAAVAVMASVIQGFALFLNPSSLGTESVHVYFAVVALVLMFNAVGKLFTIGRITGNFRFVSSGSAKYTVQNLSKRELAREFTWDMNIDEPHLSYSEKVGFIDNFIEQSYAEDSTENIAKITSPIIFIGSIVVAVFSYVLGKDLFISLSTFAGILAIASPFTSTIVGSLPQHKAYRTLSKCGAVLTGYNAVERFSETNVVLADACELFTSDEVLLHNIKTFEKNRIDEAILDASSVLCVCNGAVKNIFLRIIQGNTKMLSPVENLVYEDAMGISAWVGGKRVLIGNSDLMKHHGIDTPSHDYEAKYRTEDRDILYLANSGELTAMFVISYVRNEAVDAALGDLAHKGISVVVKSVDPNLTAAKIAKIYDLPEEMLRILPAKLHPDFDSLAKERESDKGYLVHNGTFAGFARAVSAASGVKVATNIGLIIQIVGMVLGYTLITFFSFMGSMGQATMTTVLLYQLVWGFAVWLFSALRRI